MTIKEMEFYSGLTRANIRYYESEGLLVPRRNENGYRDYSEENLETLLKIKLLRALHISLVEIKEIQNGQRTLEEVLRVHISVLEKEKQEIIYSQNVCRKMYDDCTTYEDLNAKYYLNVIKDERNSISELKVDTMIKTREPWRRYFARSFDLFLYTIIGFFIILAVFRFNLINLSTWTTFLGIFISLVLTLAIEPLFLTKFGTTPGKFILGLYVLDDQMQKLTYQVALNRTISVLKYGIGFRIPFYGPYSMIQSYFRLENKREDLEWEDECIIILKDSKWWRIILFIGMHIVVIVFLLFGVYISQFPKNRGELTLAEFCENYNQYAAYYGNEDRLQKNGKWVEYETNNGRFDLASGRPDFTFVEENGKLKEVKFVVEANGEDNILSDCHEEMNYAILAVLKAKKEIGMFSREAEKLVDEMNDNYSKGFDRTIYGIRIYSDVEYVGYNYIKELGSLLGDEGENSFYLEFSIRKI